MNFWIKIINLIIILIGINMLIILSIINQNNKLKYNNKMNRIQQWKVRLEISIINKIGIHQLDSLPSLMVNRIETKILRHKYNNKIKGVAIKNHIKLLGIQNKIELLVKDSLDKHHLKTINKLILDQIKINLDKQEMIQISHKIQEWVKIKISQASLQHQYKLEISH